MSSIPSLALSYPVCFMPSHKSAKEIKNQHRLVKGRLVFLTATLLLAWVFVQIWPAQAAEQAVESHSLQGPQGGGFVRPPSRNVTPNYQLSPLHQIIPLQRQSGKVVPKVLYPARDEARLFRNPVAKSANKIVIQRTPGIQSSSMTITLAHIRLPEASALCWRLERQLSCRTLGKFALKRFLRQRAITCDWITPSGPKHHDLQNKNLAICYTGPGILCHQSGTKAKDIQDLASWLVSHGWALPAGEYYGTQSDLAKRQKRGIYAVKNPLEQDTDTDVSGTPPLEIIENVAPFVADHIISDEPERAPSASPLPSLIGSED